MSKSLVKIVVPSLGRAGTAASAVWLQQQRRPVVFAVHSDEVRAYAKAYPWAKTLEVPDYTRRHVGALRRWIIDYYRAESSRRPFFFVDDDAYVRLVRAKSYDQMFDFLEKHLETVPMAAIGKQIFSQGLVAKSKRINGDPMAVCNAFASIVYGVIPKAFDELKLHELPVYEDVAIILHALLNGGNIVSFSATHSNKTPPEGGCNSWRTEKIVKESMSALALQFPKYVKIVETHHTAHNHELGIGVRVAWSKAAKDGDGGAP